MKEFELNDLKNIVHSRGQYFKTCNSKNDVLLKQLF